MSCKSRMAGLLIMGAALVAPLGPAKSDAFPFFWEDSDPPPPAVVRREEQLFRRYTGCDYAAALRKYGRDIDARKACHGMLFP